MSKHVTHATIDDAPHIDEKQRAEIIASYPEWELEARVKGLPSLGSGRVFPVTEESILCDSFEIPTHWPQIIGIDFGWAHYFGAVRCTWDRDGDIWYVTHTYREKEATSAIHVAAVRPWGTWIPVAWPHDGLYHDKGSGDELASQYREHGLNMLWEKATHEDGGHGIEAGVMEMLERMQTGRFKVFRGLNDWLNEFRHYHREKGLIVPIRDDLLAATRYALMMRRFALVKRKKTNVDRFAGADAWMG